jgi:hypothetical protein
MEYPQALRRKEYHKMNIDKVSNKQSFHTSIPAYQQQSDKEIIIRRVDHEIWSIECSIEELELNLSRIVENIASPVKSDNGLETKMLTVHK